MAKYAVEDLVCRSTGPTQMKLTKIYSALIEEADSGKVLFAIYTEDSKVADTISQSLATALKKSLIIEIP